MKSVRQSFSDAARPRSFHFIDPLTHDLFSKIYRIRPRGYHQKWANVRGVCNRNWYVCQAALETNSKRKLTFCNTIVVIVQCIEFINVNLTVTKKHFVTASVRHPLNGSTVKIRKHMHLTSIICAIPFKYTSKRRDDFFWSCSGK